MKKLFLFLPVFAVFILSCSSSKIQQQFTIADTLKITNERLELLNEIAALEIKIAEAEKSATMLSQQSEEAANEARKSMKESSREAEKATNGDVGDAKDAKKKADKALEDAIKAKEGNNRYKDQVNKINDLHKELKKKREKLTKTEYQMQSWRTMGTKD